MILQILDDICHVSYWPFINERFYFTSLSRGEKLWLDWHLRTRQPWLVTKEGVSCCVLLRGSTGVRFLFVKSYFIRQYEPIFEYEKFFKTRFIVDTNTFTNFIYTFDKFNLSQFNLFCCWWDWTLPIKVWWVWGLSKRN